MSKSNLIPVVKLPLPNLDNFIKMDLQCILLHWPLQTLKQLSGTTLLKIQKNPIIKICKA
jgi:hypothetical protein